MAAHDASGRWRTFLEEMKDQQIMTLLTGQSNYPFLNIPFHELQTFDPDFAEDILEFPKSILSTGSKTLIEICRERGEDVDATLRVGDLPRDSRRLLRDIGSSDVDKLRSVDVIVTKVSEIYSSLFMFIPLTISPEVIPVAQKIESPFTISFILYFLSKSVIPIFLALKISFSLLEINLP